MEPTHKIPCPIKGTWAILPSCLTTYAKKVYDNEELSWGLYKSRRNFSRKAKRIEAWLAIRAYLDKNYYCNEHSIGPFVVSYRWYGGTMVFYWGLDR